MVNVSRRTLLGAGATGALLAGLPRASEAATGQEALIGSWSAPFDMGGIAIHMQLMFNDQVLFFEYVEGDLTVNHESTVRTYDLVDGTAQNASIGYHRDLFCSGMNQLPDGRVFVSGGHDHDTGVRNSVFGVRETDIYDPLTRAWTPGPVLSMKRWYPTAVGMPDGCTLVMGGGEDKSTPSPTMDRYDPASNTMTMMPNTATKTLGLYPRLHLLNDNRVIKVGPARASIYFNYATATWRNGPAMRFGARQQGATVALLGSKKILTYGGRSTSTSAPTNTAEILDLSTPTPAWQYTGPMATARNFSVPVLLPDNTVLAVGGTQVKLYGTPVKAAELFDPVTGKWTTMASQQVVRGYHGTGVLLPDGRVLSAGSDTGTMRNYGELYSPPYLFKGPRPVITSAPAASGYGQPMVVTTDTPVTKFVLIHPGADTHQVNPDQRGVALTHTSDGLVHTLRAPASPLEAPPGYYMLFALDSQGVPAIAKWVRLELAPSGNPPT